MKTLYVQSLVTTIEECKGEARAERLEFCISLLEAALDAGKLRTQRCKKTQEMYLLLSTDHKTGEKAEIEAEILCPAVSALYLCQSSAHKGYVRQSGLNSRFYLALNMKATALELVLRDTLHYWTSRSALSRCLSDAVTSSIC